MSAWLHILGSYYCSVELLSAITHPDVNTYNSGSALARFIMHSPTSRKPSFSFSLQSIQSDDSKICVVMVGLPARGKSLIAGKGMSEAKRVMSSDRLDQTNPIPLLSYEIPRLGRNPRKGLQRRYLSSKQYPATPSHILRSSQ